MSKLFLLLVAAVVLFCFSSPACAVSTATARVSVGQAMTQGNQESTSASISADGSLVAFRSIATNLVTGDTNGFGDIFVYNLLSGQTTRVSVDSEKTQANSSSSSPSISADGTYVAFQSDATNLVPGDTNGWADIFVRDLASGVTMRVSVASDGTESDEVSFRPSISGNGKCVVFGSQATNLVAGDTNGFGDIFVHDWTKGETVRVSVSSGGEQANNLSCISGFSRPTISSDGRFAAFDSLASNLVAGDSNKVGDIFVHDRELGKTIRVSVASDGTEGNKESRGSSISGDGRYVAFSSEATNLVTGDTNNQDDVFVHDCQTGTTTRVSVSSEGTQGNYNSYEESISDDGRYVAFRSSSTNLVTGDTNGAEDIFVHDRQTGVTSRVSVGAGGAQANGVSANPSISADGHFVAFHSSATNLVSGDTNGCRDVFVHTDRFLHFAIFRPSAYDNWIFTDNVDSRTNFGMAGDIPLVGDFNNDAAPDRAVFRNGQWIVDYSMDGTVDSRTNYGTAGDIPFVGYFNDDTVLDRAVFRSGEWIIDYGFDGSVNWRPRFGSAGDKPLSWVEG